MKKLISVCLAFSFALALCLTCYGTSGTEAAADTASAENSIAADAVQNFLLSLTGNSAEGTLADGTYLTTALTSHYASNCAAGIDYDSLYDISVTVKNGVITDITYDIGANAKSVPKTAEISMEDWPFIKLSEKMAQKYLIGQPATKEAILSAWQVEKADELAKQGVDMTSGATEACRASRDAIVNIAAMNENSSSYETEYSAKDVVPEMKQFAGKVISKTVQPSGLISKTVQIDDGEYVLYGLVSANNNEIDNTAVDYNYLLKVNVTVAGGKIQTIDCSTPNGSAASQAAVAEATQIAKAALEGKDATKDAITANLPYGSRKADSFSGSVGAKIACDMISNALRNGCTHIVGWSY